MTSEDGNNVTDPSQTGSGNRPNNGPNRRRQGIQYSGTDSNDILGSCQFSYGHQGSVNHYIKTIKQLQQYARAELTKAMWRLTKIGTETTFTEPTEPPTGATEAALKKYLFDLQVYTKDKKDYDADKAKLFGLITTRCADPLLHKLESMQGYAQLEEDDDVAGLLQMIKDLVNNTDGMGRYPFWTMQETMSKLMDVRQFKNEDIHSYYTRFTEQLNVTESIWGPLIPANMKGKPTDQREKARNQFLACLFLAGASKQNETALTDLNNDYIQGNKNAYPMDVLAARQFLANRRVDGTSRNERRTNIPRPDATNFAQQQTRPNNNTETPTTTDNASSRGRPGRPINPGDDTDHGTPGLSWYHGRTESRG